jgi:hypothetical protein
LIPDRDFYVGPVGELLALTAPEAVTPAIETIQAANRSINGTSTFDLFGVKRSWSFQLAGLDHTLEDYLVSLRTGAIAGPLYLVDPMAGNYLSDATASACSTPLSQNPFTPEHVGLQVSVNATDPADFPISPRHAKQLGLENTHTSPVRLVTPTVPVLPEDYTLSVYISSTAAVTVSLGDGSSALASAASPGAGDWARVTVTAESVTGLLQPYLTVPVGATAGVAALQLERGTAATAWRPGAGTPQVVMTEMDRQSPIYPLTDVTAVFQEV